VLGRLGLDHYHRQPVKEKHDIRDDVMFRAEDAHPELADGDTAVVVAVLEWLLPETH
jgi:hypothetical protein